MHDDTIGPGLREILDVLFRVGNHQVGFKGERSTAPSCFDDQRSHGDVGHKMAIHDVDLYTLCASFFRFSYLLTQASKVGRENRGHDSNHSRMPFSIEQMSSIAPIRGLI